LRFASLVTLTPCGCTFALLAKKVNGRSVFAV
jgi:hypothetical protein